MKKTQVAFWTVALLAIGACGGGGSDDTGAAGTSGSGGTGTGGSNAGQGGSAGVAGRRDDRQRRQRRDGGDHRRRRRRRGGRPRRGERRFGRFRGDRREQRRRGRQRRQPGPGRCRRNRRRRGRTRWWRRRGRRQRWTRRQWRRRWSSGWRRPGRRRAARGGQIANPRIMPLGDSTTASICYRALLWQMLQQSGRTQFNFVGTRNGDPGCGVSGYDKDNEGHGGYIVTDVLKAAGTGVRPERRRCERPLRLRRARSRDLVRRQARRHRAAALRDERRLEQQGAGQDPEGVHDDSRALRAANPNVRVMVAQIIPLQPSGCNDCPTRAQNLNAMIPGLGCNQQHGGVADHRRRSSHRLQPGDGTGHQRRRAPQRRRLSEDRDQVVQRADRRWFHLEVVTACAPGC